MVQGEAIAWYHGEEGYQRAVEATHKPEAGSPEHALALWTARFARTRLDDLKGNDYASKLELKAKWRRRRGSLLDEDHPIEDLLSAR
jgi:hypothetical protein